MLVYHLKADILFGRMLKIDLRTQAKHYFILISFIKYLRMLNISD